MKVIGPLNLLFIGNSKGLCNWFTRLKTGSKLGCNTFRPIDDVSSDKGLWVPGDCLSTQTNIATTYNPQSSDSDKPIGSVRWSMLRTVME